MDYDVNCRIGSLESEVNAVFHHIFVNCRIGSLENLMSFITKEKYVNCRIGSLEIHQQLSI